MQSFKKCLFLILLLACAGMVRAQTREPCLVCHGNSSLAVRRGGQEVSLYVDANNLAKSVHASLACVDCHQGLNPAKLPHAKVISPVRCQSCHSVAGYDASVHGQVFGAQGCSNCHGTHYILASSNPDSRVNSLHQPSTCGKCHGDENSRYLRSAHGMALEKGTKGVPSCADCHGAHEIVPVSDPGSVLFKTRQPEVCLRCHLNNPEVRRKVGVAAGFIAGYEASVHGVLLSRGNTSAAACSDCHGAHEVLGARDPQSRINKYVIPDTCGQCHKDIETTYYQSIHGTALKAGNDEAPNCTDCHGEHQIFAPTDPRSRVAGRNVSSRVCGACHSSLPLTEKYGLASERFRTFEDSYHGLASMEGSVRVANCASCHGYHNIKPSSDPTSSINPANLAATCGKCHQGANENFAVGPVHLLITSKSEPVLYWIRFGYVSLIILIIGGMLLHNVMDFRLASKQRFAMRSRFVPPERFGDKRYVRMTLNERIQHGVLAAAFVTLVVTGFMLKFPDAWWVAPIRAWSAKLFAIRGTAHRIAGATLIAAGLYHLYYILFVPRGRQLLRDLRPRLLDVHEVGGVARYYLGLAREKPRFGRFSYIEKAEYWALIWGSVVMGATGIILWFNNYFIGLFTLLGWDVSQAVHYYEAILATLAILVWHFYFTIFSPSVYPMNTSWIRGTLTEEEMAEDHPQELERIQTEQMQEEMEEDTKTPDA